MSLASVVLPEVAGLAEDLRTAQSVVVPAVGVVEGEIFLGSASLASTSSVVECPRSRLAAEPAALLPHCEHCHPDLYHRPHLSHRVFIKLLRARV